MSFWMTFAIPGALLLIFIGWQFLRAPYEIYKETCEKHDAEIEKKDKQIDGMAADILILKGQLAEKSEADKLVIERQKAKSKIADAFVDLNNRLREATSLPRLSFNGALKADELEKTQRIIDRAAGVFIQHNLFAEAARYMGALGLPVVEILDDPNFGESRMDWRWHINHIAAKLDKLEEIIKELP